MKINSQIPATKEVEPEKTINAGARWQGVPQDWKLSTLLPQSHNPVECDAWHKFDATACSHLNTVGYQCWVVTEGNQHPYVHHRERRSSVECEAKDGTTVGSPQFC